MVKHLIKIDFRQIKIYFCELRKKNAGSNVVTLAAFAINNLYSIYMDF